MQCPACDKQVPSDRRFCPWCERFIPEPRVGTKAGFGRRLMATILDSVLFWVLFLLVMAVAASAFAAVGDVGGFLFGVFLAGIGYVIVLLWFLSRGLTPGKYLVGEQVVDHLSGGYPGLGKMLAREVFGKVVSGLFFGVGYFWAIWDPNGQAWHDKIAGTVVVVRPPGVGALQSVSAVGAIPMASARVAAIPPAAIPASVSRFCTSCGAARDPRDRFCVDCGAAQA